MQRLQLIACTRRQKGQLSECLSCHSSLPNECNAYVLSVCITQLEECATGGLSATLPDSDRDMDNHDYTQCPQQTTVGMLQPLYHEHCIKGTTRYAPPSHKSLLCTLAACVTTCDATATIQRKHAALLCSIKVHFSGCSLHLAHTSAEAQ